MGDLLQRTEQPAATVEYLTFVQHHPATDDRVRNEAKEFLVELTTVLPPEILKVAQAKGRAHSLEELVTTFLAEL